MNKEKLRKEASDLIKKRMGDTAIQIAAHVGCSTPTLKKLIDIDHDVSMNRVCDVIEKLK